MVIWVLLELFWGIVIVEEILFGSIDNEIVLKTHKTGIIFDNEDYTLLVIMI